MSFPKFGDTYSNLIQKGESHEPTNTNNEKTQGLYVGGAYRCYCNHFNLDINDDKWLNPTEEEAPPVGENEDIIFTDGSTGAADITASAETADAGQQEETEETEEETDAISDIDVTFE